MEYSLLFLFLVLITASIQVSLCVVNGLSQRRKAKAWNCQEPKHVPQNPLLLGLDLIKRRNDAIKAHKYHQTNNTNHELYGLTFGAWLAGARIISTIDLENLQYIYSSHAFDWGIEPVRRFAFEPLAAYGIMTSDGHEWKNARSRMRKVFSNQRQTNLSALEGHVQSAIALIHRTGGIVDLQEVFNYLAFDSATEMMFGRAKDSLSPDALETRILLKSFSQAKTEVFHRMMRPKINALSTRAFWGWCRTARDYIDAEVTRLWDNRLKSSVTSKQYSLGADLALRIRDYEQLRAQITNLMFSAYDGVSASVTNVFFHLARHPHVVRRLRAEICALDAIDLTAERLRNMEYLQSVINEAYRLTPPVGMNARTALRDTYIPRGGGKDGSSGVFVAKGQTVFTPLFALSRRKGIFGADADQFRPERWESLKSELPRWSFIPFGGGPRVCLGQHMVMTETAYITVRFLQNFEEIENRDPVEEFVEHLQVTLISKNGVKVVMKPVQGH